MLSEAIDQFLLAFQWNQYNIGDNNHTNGKIYYKYFTNKVQYETISRNNTKLTKTERSMSLFAISKIIVSYLQIKY